MKLYTVSYIRCASCPTKSDDVLISYFGLIVLDLRMHKIADLNRLKLILHLSHVVVDALDSPRFSLIRVASLL